MATACAPDVLAYLPADAGVAVARDGATTIIGAVPAKSLVASGPAAFAALDAARRGGFWAGYLSYDLGRHVERVERRTASDGALPDLALARYDDRLVLRPGAEPEVVGSGPGAELLARAAWRARRGAPAAAGAALGPWTSSLDRAEHATRVAAIVDMLRAGECYQVNLTRQLRSSQAADPVALFRALASVNPAPYLSFYGFGAALPGVYVVSASPECFLRVDGRSVETRPIKGTHVDAERLAASAKDHAENVMIVDLARNDLGRVCEYGSITVPALCEIEAHPGLYHLVSTVRGRLRSDATLTDAVRATFPPASVTGAPKPRVMQAIEDLEPVRRGIYCGAVGWIDGDNDRADLAVAIRTFVVTPEATTLGVGGGIVADSRADTEWAETELKAGRVLLAAAGGVDADALGSRP